MAENQTTTTPGPLESYWLKHTETIIEGTPGEWGSEAHLVIRALPLREAFREYDRLLTDCEAALRDCDTAIVEWLDALSPGYDDIEILEINAQRERNRDVLAAIDAMKAGAQK